MENTALGGRQNTPTEYDYRMYDRIWQRVSPSLDPYPDVRAAQTGAPEDSAPQPVPQPPSGGKAIPAPAMENGGNEENLPGAEMDPCCMGSVAMESVEVLEGFIEEELAESRCCLALACRTGQPGVVRLLRRTAAEKQAAAQELRTAYYLITGACYTPAITVEHMKWSCLADALRSCYHQEACNGFNYQRAADGTTDLCLQKLLSRLSRQSYQRADAVMATLGRILC